MNIRKLFWENLRLDVYDKRRDAYFKSLIQEINPDNIGIGMPMLQKSYLYMPTGSQWFFRLVHKDVLYNFYSTMIGKKSSDSHISLYLIDWPAKVTRFQRREHFRLEYNLKVHFWILDEINYKASKELPKRQELQKAGRSKRDTEQLALELLAESLGPPQEGITLDISGGGLQLVTKKRFEQGTIFLMRIFLYNKKEEPPILIKGQAVYIFPPPKDSARRFRYAVEFIDTSENLKDEFVRFIFTASRDRKPL